jgi:hypothetical protein
VGTAVFWTRFALAALATWRITHLLAREDGPGDAVLRMRQRAGGGVLGRLMDCFYCLSLWVAAPFALWVTRAPLDLVLCWLALSGAACLLERTGAEPVVIATDMSPEPGFTQLESGGTDGMLRAETGRTAGAKRRPGAADEKSAKARVAGDIHTDSDSVAGPDAS